MFAVIYCQLFRIPRYFELIRVVLDGLFRVNKSSKVHADRQKEAE